MRHSLPVLQDPRRDPLDQIEIPIPCEVPWDSMAGDERIRHCGQCRQNVYNVAAFTRPEALRLLEANEGRVCLRIYRRPDGTVLTANCRERLRAARKRGWAVFAGVLVVVLWAELCAQVVGLLALRRLTGGSIQGGMKPVPAAVQTPPNIPVPAIAPPTMGVPPPPPSAEEVLGGLTPRVRHGGVRSGGHKMGKPAPAPMKPQPKMGEAVMGDVIDRL